MTRRIRASAIGLWTGCLCLGVILCWANAALSQPSDDLTADADALVRRAEARLAAAEEHGESIESLAERIDLLLTILGDSRDVNGDLKVRLTTLGEELDEAQSARREAKLTNESLRAEMGALAAEIATLTAANADLRFQLAARGNAAQDVEREMQARDREIAELKAELNEAQNQLTRSASELAARERQIVHLQAALERVADSDPVKAHRGAFLRRLQNVPVGRIVGDRYLVFVSDLFQPGSAELTVAGRRNLDLIAEALSEALEPMPARGNWQVRIEGHASDEPLDRAKFPSDWDISSTQAVSVVRYLTGRGIAADRLSAAGLGAHHPLDPREDEIARHRNRRIEIRLSRR